VARKNKSAKKVVIYASEDIASWLVGAPIKPTAERRVLGDRVLIPLAVMPHKLLILMKEKVDA
jgi:hypothetical protein